MPRPSQAPGEAASEQHLTAGSSAHRCPPPGKVIPLQTHVRHLPGLSAGHTGVTPTDRSPAPQGCGAGDLGASVGGILFFGDCMVLWPTLRPGSPPVSQSMVSHPEVASGDRGSGLCCGQASADSTLADCCPSPLAPVAEPCPSPASQACLHPPPTHDSDGCTGHPDPRPPRPQGHCSSNECTAQGEPLTLSSQGLAVLKGVV